MLSYGPLVCTTHIDSNDWKRASSKATVLSNIKTDFSGDKTKGHIILCHDNYSYCTVDALQEIYDTFTAEGYKFVSLQQCLGNVNPYQ